MAESQPSKDATFRYIAATEGCQPHDIHRSNASITEGASLIPTIYATPHGYEFPTVGNNAKGVYMGVLFHPSMPRHGTGIKAFLACIHRSLAKATTSKQGIDSFLKAWTEKDSSGRSIVATVLMGDATEYSIVDVVDSLWTSASYSLADSMEVATVPANAKVQRASPKLQQWLDGSSPSSTHSILHKAKAVCPSPAFSGFMKVTAGNTSFKGLPDADTMTTIGNATASLASASRKALENAVYRKTWTHVQRLSIAALFHIPTGTAWFSASPAPQYDLFVPFWADTSGGFGAPALNVFNRFQANSAWWQGEALLRNKVLNQALDDEKQFETQALAQRHIIQHWSEGLETSPPGSDSRGRSAITHYCVRFADSTRRMSHRELVESPRTARPLSKAHQRALWNDSVHRSMHHLHYPKPGRSVRSGTCFILSKIAPIAFLAVIVFLVCFACSEYMHYLGKPKDFPRMFHRAVVYWGCTALQRTMDWVPDIPVNICRSMEDAGAPYYLRAILPFLIMFYLPFRLGLMPTISKKKRKIMLNRVSALPLTAEHNPVARADETKEDEGEYEADVVIVGAGAAGLMAARRCAEAGLKVCVLEARDRVGGRTCTVLTQDGQAADVGGQWLGSTQRRCHDLVKELGLELYAQRGTKPEHGKSVVIMEGKRVAYKGLIPLLPSFIPGVPSVTSLLDLQRNIDKLDAEGAKVPVEAPWEADDAVTLDSITVEQAFRSQCWSLKAKKMLEIATRTIFGVEPACLSYLYFLQFTRGAGGLMALAEVENGAQETKIVGGAQQLSIGLWEHVKRLGGVVHLNAAVASIAHEGADASTVEQSPVQHLEKESDPSAWARLSLEARHTQLSRASNSVRVATTDGRVFRAKYAIVTIPAPLTHTIRFQPSLPHVREVMVQRMGMGCITKFLVRYETPFWTRDGYNGLALDSRGPVSCVYDGSSPEGNVFWLVGFIAGEHSVRLGQLSRDERRKAVTQHLGVMFDSTEAESPLEYIDKNWGEEEYSRGCYFGSLPPGVLTQSKNALKQPFGRVHFAGTETATEWSGYIEGALQSGERAAGEVLARL